MSRTPVTIGHVTKVDCHYKSIPCGDHRGYAMYFLTNSYNCPALKLYGYSTDLALTRAIERVLNTKFFTIIVEVNGAELDKRVQVKATTSHKALLKAVIKARKAFPNANSWEARLDVVRP